MAVNATLTLTNNHKESSVMLRSTFFRLYRYTSFMLRTGLVLVVSLLAACVPVAERQDLPLVAVVNAPSENRVDGLAARLQTFLDEDIASNGYRFMRVAAVRQQEAMRDMFAERALLQTAFIARSRSGSLGLMVGVVGTVFIDDVDVFTDEVRIRYSTSTYLDMGIVDAATAELVWAHQSPSFSLYDERYFDLNLPEGLDPESPEGAKEITKQVKAFRESITLRSLSASTGLFDKELKALTPLIATELAFWTSELASR